MRFVSFARKFKKGLIPAETQNVGGMVVEVSPGFVAHFNPHPTPADVEAARARHRYKLREGEDLATRLSVFDTDEEAERDGWTPELKEQIEQALLRGQNAHYFLCGESPAERPWPAYDVADPATIIDTAELVGVGLDQVLAYERQHKDRNSVVKALEAKLGETGIVVAA